MIELSNLSMHFGGVVALDNVSVKFTAPVSGIIGPNGAGKTTTINVISGFLPCSGSIQYMEKEIGQLPAYKRSRWGLRRSFQKEQIADDLTVLDNLKVILDTQPRSTIKTGLSADHALEATGLQDKRFTMAAQLNNYERRMVDIARCLIASPKIIMFDEPGGGLSSSETHALGELISVVHSLTGANTLLIDHDVDLISQVCQETLVLDFGKRIAFGPTRNILSDPKVRSAYLGIEEVDG